jgi:hypothetical protein
VKTSNFGTGNPKSAVRWGRMAGLTSGLACAAALIIFSLAGPALAQKKTKGGGSGGGGNSTGTDIGVTTYVSDVDASGAPYYLHSDDGSPTSTPDEYQNGVNNVISILVANGYNGIVNGDWRLDLITNSSSRSMGVHLDTDNEIVPGTATPNPPYWGTQPQQVRMENKCTFDNKNMLTMKAGDTFTCPTLIRLTYGATSSSYYGLSMAPSFTGQTETQPAQIQCNSVASDGNCNDWFIDPIPVANLDGSTSPGKTEARLSLKTTKGKSSSTDEGDFYMTFHIHVTRQ